MWIKNENSDNNCMIVLLNIAYDYGQKCDNSGIGNNYKKKKKKSVIDS